MPQEQRTAGGGYGGRHAARRARRYFFLPKKVGQGLSGRVSGKRPLRLLTRSRSGPVRERGSIREEAFGASEMEAGRARAGGKCRLIGRRKYAVYRFVPDLNRKRYIGVKKSYKIELSLLINRKPLCIM